MYISPIMFVHEQVAALRLHDVGNCVAFLKLHARAHYRQLCPEVKRYKSSEQPLADGGAAVPAVSLRSISKIAF